LTFQGEAQAFSAEQPAFFQPDETCEGGYFAATPIDYLGEIERVVGKPALEERVRQLKERGSLLIGNILRAYQVLLGTNFAEMQPHDFEKFVALLLEQMGYTAEVTPKTGDYGLDIVARKGAEVIAVQCKKYRENNVGNQEVQQLLGAMQLKGVNASRGILVTTSRFTKQAINQAMSTPVELWDRDVLHPLIRRYLMDG
jgi:restriction endonuclease Mrr